MTQEGSSDAARAVVRAMVWAIRVYQRATRWLPPVCRFRPSCSEYAIGALRTHGPARGMLLGLGRILKCSPWCPGGDDPVPPRRRSAANAPPSDENGQTG